MTPEFERKNGNRWAQEENDLLLSFLPTLIIRALQMNTYITKNRLSLNLIFDLSPLTFFLKVCETRVPKSTSNTSRTLYFNVLPPPHPYPGINSRSPEVTSLHRSILFHYGNCCYHNWGNHNWLQSTTGYNTAFF